MHGRLGTQQLLSVTNRCYDGPELLGHHLSTFDLVAVHPCRGVSGYALSFGLTDGTLVPSHGLSYPMPFDRAGDDRSSACCCLVSVWNFRGRPWLRLNLRSVAAHRCCGVSAALCPLVLPMAHRCHRTVSAVRCLSIVSAKFLLLASAWSRIILRPSGFLLLVSRGALLCSSSCLGLRL